MRAPKEHVQIAQPARTFFDIGFKRVGGVFVLLMALTHLKRFSAIEIRRIHLKEKFFLKPRENFCVAANQARLKKCGLHRNVFLAFLNGVVNRANRASDIKPHVPKLHEKALDFLGLFIFRFFF